MKDSKQNKKTEKKAKIAAKNPFLSASVMLAKLETVVPEDGDWYYEIKYDGYRMLAYIEAGKARLVSRNGNDYTEKFLSISKALEEWAGDRAIVLDGEMIVTDDNGRSDFDILQSYIKKPEGVLSYVIFDLLAYNGEDFRKKTLHERKEKLEKILKNAPSNLHYSKHVEGNGKACFQAACDSGLEGIIGKKASSTYNGTRNGTWIKLKCENRQEFIICGYVPSDKKTLGLSSVDKKTLGLSINKKSVGIDKKSVGLSSVDKKTVGLNSIDKKTAGLASVILGYYKDNKLTYAGRAGSGLSESVSKKLLSKFEKIETKNSSFEELPKSSHFKKAVWLKPQLVAEVKFTEWTKDNLLRHPSFKGLRNDKNPIDIIRENANIKETKQISSSGKLQKISPNSNQKNNQNSRKTAKNRQKQSKVEITNPQKIVFQNPQITKNELAEYYKAVSQRMLPYIQNRILSLVCCPKGVTDACFFKKHNLGGEGMSAVQINNSKGETEEYFYISNPSGIISMVQNNTIEFHTWASNIDNLDKPDIMVFDLDPDEGMELKQIRQGVKDLKSVLDELSLKSYLKTSGGKGYHIVVPFKESVDFETFKNFAKSVATLMEQKWSNRYTTNVRKEKRKGKIFIDFLRNGKGATSVAPYSVRAREGAKISLPIEWNQLNKIAPSDITIQKALKTLTQKDPWQDFFPTKASQQLTPN